MTPRNLHHVVIGLGGSGFRAICSCGWQSAASWDRNTVVRSSDKHKTKTRLRSVP